MDPLDINYVANCKECGRPVLTISKGGSDPELVFTCKCFDQKEEKTIKVNVNPVPIQVHVPLYMTIPEPNPPMGPVYPSPDSTPYNPRRWDPITICGPHSSFLPHGVSTYS